MPKRRLREPRLQEVDWVKRLHPGDMLAVRRTFKHQEEGTLAVVEFEKGDGILITRVTGNSIMQFKFVGLHKGTIITIAMLISNIPYWFEFVASIDDALD